MSHLERTRRLFSELNEVASATPYLAMYDRDVEVHVGDETLCVGVQKCQVTVRGGAAAQPERTVLHTDPETWNGIVSGRLGFTEAGGGLGHKLRVVAGHGSWTDLSWIGILTRLAQENR